MEFIANLIDIPRRDIFAARVTVSDGRIGGIEPTAGGSIDPGLPYLLPGFIDAHVHVESSMLVPSQFAKLAVRHGTIATVSDPHEIANVMGVEGVDFMIRDGAGVPLKFFFGAPSCVPATTFETAGATLDANDVRELLARDEILYLAEMMNYPGVLHRDEEVMRKIEAARSFGKPVDGHAPGVVGEDAARYIAAGISTDHECTTLEEAEHKLAHGMKILIREGSAAKNFEVLYPLIDRYPESVMLCSDDKHPDDLAESHINAIVRRAVDRGCDMFNVLGAACLNPIDHYRLPLGRLRVGDAADFILCDDLKQWRITHTYIDGQLVAEDQKALFDPEPADVINRFDCRPKQPVDFATDPREAARPAIKAIDGSLFTESVTIDSASEADVAKLAVVNRYCDADVATCRVVGFGIERGAIASCVAHDSHNILAVGADDESLCRAVNLVIEHHGGLVALDDDGQHVLPLPVAGIMTNGDGDEVARRYGEIDRFAKQRLGSTLTAPLMTLSFMALLVIPSLKLSDRGLFDGQRFCFVE